MTSDMFWSYFSMPIGTLICFGPAVIVWLLFGSKTPESTSSAGERTQH